MSRYAALLRGVNVGGINLAMSDVAAVFTGLGLGNVRTVLASGNVLFDSDDTAGFLKPRIEAALGERFGYEAWVHVLSLESVRRVVDGFPFDEKRAGWHPYVVFVSEPNVRDELIAASADADAAVERVSAGDGVIYWTVERGNSVGSPFAKQLARSRFKSTTTTRNLRTLQKLLR